MHGQTAGSSAPRWAMTAAHVAGTAAGAFLLAREGLSLREAVLLACGVLYLLRFLTTSFLFLKRRVDWAEAFQVAPLLFAVQAGFGYLGSRSAVPWHWSDGLFAGLYLLGSFLNTVSEWQRMRWKRRPEHGGRLYTGGLFSLSMHVNYFGDALLFTGFALLTASLWALLVPIAMTILFVTVHIPTLDAYLAKRYPEDFEAWARTSRRFVPFLY